MKKKYPISAYTYDIVLKIPFLLWFFIIYSSRYFVFIAAIGASARFSSKTKILMPSDMFGFSLSALVSTLALLVLIAALNRNEKAGKFVKKVWLNGRLLLILSASGDLTFLVWAHYLNNSRLEPAAIIFIAIDLCALGYLIFSPRPRDTFLEFPEKLKK